MRPGKLDQRIQIQRTVRTPDGGGGTEATWENVAKVWANVFAKGGGERQENDRIDAAGMVSFTIRNRRDLNETMRIVWDGDFYNIRNIPNEGKRKLYLSIEAERGVADVQ